MALMKTSSKKLEHCDLDLNCLNHDIRYHWVIQAKYQILPQVVSIFYAPPPPPHPVAFWMFEMLYPGF